jgi:hypothetical protein
MAEATHATVTTLRRVLSKLDEQNEAFRQMVERGFGDVPGFVAGLWTFDPAACELVVIHSFDSLATAEAFADMARNDAERQVPLGLELMSVRVNEVILSV